MAGLPSIASINEVFRGAAEAVLARRLTILAAIFALVVLMAAGLPKLKVDTSQESWFLEGDETIAAKQRFEEIFGSDDSCLVLVRSEKLLTAQNLALVREMGRELENETPWADDVLSIADFEFIDGTEGGMEILSLVPDDLEGFSDEDGLALGRRILSKEIWRNFLISDDMREALIVLRLKPSTSAAPGEPHPNLAIGAKVLEVVARPKYAPLKPVASGLPIVDVEKRDYFGALTSKLILMSVIIIAAAMAVAARDPKVAILPFLITVAALLGVFGAEGHLGQSLDPMTVFLPVFLAMGMSTCYCVHVVSQFKAALPESGERREAVLRAAGRCGWPLLASALTTMAGLACFAVIPIRPIRWVGFTSAALIGAVWLLSWLLMPIFLSFGRDKKALAGGLEEAASPVGADGSIMPGAAPGSGASVIIDEGAESGKEGLEAEKKGLGLKGEGLDPEKEGLESKRDGLEPEKKDGSIIGNGIVNPASPSVNGALPKADILDRALDHLGRKALSRPKLTIAVSAVLFAVAMAGAARLEVSFDVRRSYGVEVPYIQRMVEVGDSNVGSLYSYGVAIELPEPDMAKQPEVLGALNVLAAEIEAFPLTKRVRSVSDVIMDLSQAVNDGDPAFRAIPETREAIAQELLLYESAGGAESERWVDYDYQRLRLQVEVSDYNSAEIDRNLREVRRRAQELFPGAIVILTGAISEFTVAMQYVTWGQVKTFFLALASITLVMAIAFRSLRIALIALIPNAMPVLAMAGVMGWFGMPLEIMTVVIVPMLLGLAVDDTIHIVNHSLLGFQKTGSYAMAARLAIKGVGRAVVLTTAVLILAFSPYLAAKIHVFSNMGMLIGLGLLTALLADLFLTPVILMLAKAFGPEKLI